MVDIHDIETRAAKGRSTSFYAVVSSSISWYDGRLSWEEDFVPLIIYRGGGYGRRGNCFRGRRDFITRALEGRTAADKGDVDGFAGLKSRSIPTWEWG